MAGLSGVLLVPVLVLAAASLITATSEPVTRRPRPLIPRGTLRLNHPYGCSTEGYLEIYIEGRWGTICNDNFDVVDATVACRQLGYTRGLFIGSPAGRVRYRGIPGPIYLDQMGCNYNDTRILDCPHNPIGLNDCNHAEDAYIACTNGTTRRYCPGSSTHNVQEGAIRIRDGACAAEGRLEIFHRNEWGTICDDGFGSEEAIIACRELGYDSGVPIKAPAPGMGRIWLDDLACTLQHATLAECGGSSWGREDCSHSEDAGVLCFNSSATIDCFGQAVPNDGAVRLMSGNCDFEGRLEVWHAHRWGTVCDDRFDDVAATTACRQLGHQRGWVHTAAVADVSTQIWLKQVVCNATTQRLQDCSHAQWGSVYGCDHNKDVGILCSNSTSKRSCAGDEINHQDGDLRLMEGDCADHGRLEVYHSGRWGTVCDDSFTDQAATVACQQLGYRLGFIKAAPAGSGITWLDNVQCGSTASGRLGDVCAHSPWGQEDCGHSEDIGIQCYNGTGSVDCHGVPFPPEGKLQLTDTACKHSGRLEIFHAGRWGTVCDVGFEVGDIDVACRQMGHQSGVLGANDVSAVATVLAHKRVWLKDVTCRAGATRLMECTHSAWGAPGCDHNQDVFITCKNETDARDCRGQTINFEEGLIRLTEGRNKSSGRLEIFHSGRWGTVCDDSFGQTDATVSCRQLGFHRGNLGNRLLAPEGSGPTWLDEVRCLPTNTKLGECHHNAWGREDCSHSEDVRLLCDNTTECDSNPCQNSGTCVVGFNRYTCSCQAGYSGINCQTNLNECESNPCVNGATCQDGINDYTCMCVDGYSGKNCSIDIDDCHSSPCKNGATCVDRLRDYDCNCAAGYKGVECTINIDECASIPCHAGGTCQDGINDYTCICKPGFSGKRCHINTDDCNPNPCKNNGTCLDGDSWYFCRCPAKYYGNNCENKYKDNCMPDPCKNNGTCVDGDNWYFCRCPAKYYGDNCENKNEGKMVPGHNTVDGKGGRAASQAAAAPAGDHATKGVAIAAIFLSIIALIIVMVLIVRYSQGSQRTKKASLGDQRRADFRWRLLSQTPAETSSEGRDDETVFYNQSSDKVNLVA